MSKNSEKVAKITSMAEPPSTKMLLSHSKLLGSICNFNHKARLLCTTFPIKIIENGPCMKKL